MLEINKIYNEDCLGSNGMCLIPDKSVDMILCDLPYGVTARNKWDKNLPLDKLWEQYNRIIKDNGAIVLTSMQPFTTDLINSNRRYFKYVWVWYKHQITGFLNAKKQPLRCHEDIVVFYKKQPTYNPQMTKGKMQNKSTGSDSTNYGKYKHTRYYSDTYYPTSIIDVPQIRVKDGHPIQKPVELFEYLIKTYTNEGDLVLDNCMGSGTTAIACINTNRKFIGFEWSPAEPHDLYYTKAVQRVEEQYNKCVIDDEAII